MELGFDISPGERTTISNNIINYFVTLTVTGYYMNISNTNKLLLGKMPAKARDLCIFCNLVTVDSLGVNY